MAQWIEYNNKFICLDNISHFDVYEYKQDMEKYNKVLEQLGGVPLTEQIPPVFQVHAYIATSYYLPTLGGIDLDNRMPRIFIDECKTLEEGTKLIRDILTGRYAIVKEGNLIAKE